MVITRLKARLTPEQAAKLKTSYAQTQGPYPPGFVESFLVKGQNDPSDWRILTVWESQAAVDAMRASGQTPRGVQIFRDAGVEPELKILNVADRRP